MEEWNSMWLGENNSRGKFDLFSSMFVKES
jgi:hypothetical protein